MSEKTIPLFTTADVCKANDTKHRTLLDWIKKGRFPAPAVTFPLGRGLFVWTEAQLKNAGFTVPESASLTLNLGR